MEDDLVLPPRAEHQESDVWQPEEPEIYLEAKLYVEKMEMEQRVGSYTKEDRNSPQASEDLEPSVHRVSLTMYPIAHPSSPLSYATVQWDVPDTPTEIPPPGTVTCSADELDSSGGGSLDWTASPLSAEEPSSIDMEREGTQYSEVTEDITESHNGVEEQLSVTSDHRSNFKQACDAQDSDMKTSVTQTLEAEDPALSEVHRGTTPTTEPQTETGPTAAEETVEPTERSWSSVCSADSDTHSGSRSPDSMQEEERTDTAVHTQTRSQQECSVADEEDEGLEVDEEENVPVSFAQNGEYAEEDTTEGWEQPEQLLDGNDTELTKQPEPVPFTDQSEQMEEREQQNLEEESKHAEQTELINRAEIHGQSEHTEESEQRRESAQTHESNDTEQTEISEKTKQSAYTEESDQTIDSKQTERLEQTEPSEITEQFDQPEITEELEKTEQSEQNQQSGVILPLDLNRDQLPQIEYSEQKCAGPTECSEQKDQSECPVEMECLEQSEHSDQTEHYEQIEQMEDSEQLECLVETDGSEQSKQTKHSEQTKQTEHMECSEQTKQTEQMERSEQTKQREQTVQSEQTKQSEYLNHTEQKKQTEQTEQSEQTKEQPEPSECSEQTEESPQTKHIEQSDQINQTECPEKTEQSKKQSECSEQMEQPGQTKQKEQTEQSECSEQTKQSEQTGDTAQTEDSSSQHLDGRGEQLEGQTHQAEPAGPAVSCMNGGGVDREKAERLAGRLYRLEDIQRTDVVRHLDKDNEFSRVVGEEYLKFFDFTGESLDQGLRSFLRVVVLIGETQERERVLQHFSTRFQQCNPQTFSSAGTVLTLTCAVMLLNTDLHGQNVGKAMTLSDFVSNIDGMNEGENFHKDLLKGLYNSIKNEQLEWAVDEMELASSMMLAGDVNADPSLRSKSNPFQDVPHDKKATVFHKGFLKRKAHADIDGKRIPWGKRSWKTFYAVLKGMVLYLQKDEYHMEWQNTEEVISLHHALAERALDYTKKPHVFRLQTADWRVFLFQEASTAQMNSWIGRINLVSALYSSPPFPAACGSQRRFCRPILPAPQSTLTMDKQLQSHATMLQSFTEDLTSLQQAFPEGRRAKARELEEHKLKEEYLQHEMCRYEVYVQMLGAWQGLGPSSGTTFGTNELSLFDRAVSKGTEDGKEEEEAGGGLTRSYSSPSLELEMAPPPMVKVRRNISERRTYRKIIIPRRNREL